MKKETRGENFTIKTRICPGSQQMFLAEKIRSRLQLPYRKSHFEIIVIGGQKQSASKESEFTLYARRTNRRIFEILQSKELHKLDLDLGNENEEFINIEGIKKSTYDNNTNFWMGT